MQWVRCPACGRTAGRERTSSGPVLFHGPYAGDECFGSEVREEDAEAVRLISEQGGERFRLAAHP